MQNLDSQIYRLFKQTNTYLDSGDLETQKPAKIEYFYMHDYNTFLN